MKTRLRWFDLGTEQIAVRKVADAMARMEYTRKRGQGFRLTEVRRSYIVGGFFERIEWDDQVEDPLGGAQAIHRVEMRRIVFRIDAPSAMAQVTDAPRGLRSFQHAIAECFEGDVTLSPVRLTPSEWLVELERTTGKGLVVAVHGSGLALSSATAASVLIEGTEDVRRYLPRLTQGRPVQLDRVIVRLQAPYGGACELLAHGRAVVHDATEDTIRAVRDALRNGSRSSARPSVLSVE